MMKLRLGWMTSKEIAEWLGVTYKTYEKNPKKQLTKLDGYCKFTQKRGGIQVEEIYFNEYRGKLNSQVIRDYVNEVRQSRISSSAGMARKFKHENREAYRGIEVCTLTDQLQKAGRVTFGPIQKKTSADPALGGRYGYRVGVWVIKVGDYNQYRELTEEENRLFDRILVEYYGAISTEDLKAAAALETEFKKTDMTKEEYFKEKKKRGLDFFGQCVLRFSEETGETLTRCSEHMECAWGEQEIKIKEGEYSF